LRAHNTSEDTVITVDENRITVRTATLTAILDRGVLVSLARQGDGTRLVDAAVEKMLRLAE
jgi:hypothetical protein